MVLYAASDVFFYKFKGLTRFLLPENPPRTAR